MLLTAVQECGGLENNGAIHPGGWGGTGGGMVNLKWPRNPDIRII